MTDGAAASPSREEEAFRRLLRRAGHELRNAQNAAAVNLEVVRSRVAAGKSDGASLQSFAENAARGLEDSARLAEALVSLCAAITTAFATGKVTAHNGSGAGVALEVSMQRDSAARLAAGLAVLAERAGFGVETSAAGVILRIPPDDEQIRA